MENPVKGEEDGPESTKIVIMCGGINNEPLPAVLRYGIAKKISANDRKLSSEGVFGVS
ncbi:hypothetical protein B0H12DRAFT_1105700 [Mycena haematopus]|nr:hypothetical protein B0H12DRAFT_1105700 [Mycena haematopus]